MGTLMTTPDTTPEQHLRRTPLHRALEQAGARWTAIGDTATAAGLGSEAGARKLAITDLSALPRLGFKGRETIPAMKARGLVLEAEPNRAFRQPDGGLCLVLAASEVILLAPLSGHGEKLQSLHDGWRLQDMERTYPMLRRDSQAWFAVTGAKAPEMFAKICGIDFRLDRFADLSIAQTSVAKISAIVTRADIGTTPAFHILADSASALYFFECLNDAAQEFGGEIACWDILRNLESG
jgi:sarcosine oxidase subunit gamma